MYLVVFSRTPLKQHLNSRPIVTFFSLSQDVSLWIKDKEEVEKVDLFLQIKEKLVCLFFIPLVNK